MKLCVICRKPLAPSKQSHSVCYRKSCRQSHKEWCKANWDLLDENNKYRDKYESEFWEVTQEQKEYYASFFALIRSAIPPKKRKCLSCGEDLTSFKMETRGARICAPCHVKINKIGALACQHQEHFHPVSHELATSTRQTDLSILVQGSVRTNCHPNISNVLGTRFTDLDHI